MNWTGGHLQQSKRNQNNITAKQRSYFAKSRTRNLTSKRKALTNPSDHQHTHSQHLPIYTQDCDDKALEPPDWLPKKLWNSFLKTQRPPELYHTETSGLDRHEKRQYKKNAPPKDETAICLETSRISHTPKEVEDEAKRQALLHQKDWFATGNQSCTYRSAPHDRTRIGKRRKLKQDDLARISIQRKVPTNRTNLNLAPSAGSLKPSQISVRLGSQIHGTQKTLLSGSRLAVKSTAASDVTTGELRHISTGGGISHQALVETPIRSIASFHALEEMVTPSQNTSQIIEPVAMRSKIEQWISESALKERRAEIPSATTNNKLVAQSPQSLEVEYGSSEESYQEREIVHHEDTRYHQRKQGLSGHKRSLDRYSSQDCLLPVSFTSEHSVLHDGVDMEASERDGPGSRQEINTEETAKSIITETHYALTEERSATSLLMESKAIAKERVTLLSSDAKSPYSSSPSNSVVIQNKDSYSQSPKHIQSVLSPVIPSSKSRPIEDEVSDDARAGSVSLEVAETPRSRIKRQESEWLKWIMGLHQESEKAEEPDHNEAPDSQILTQCVAQPIHTSDTTLMSHIQDHPSMQTVEESIPKLPTEFLLPIEKYSVLETFPVQSTSSHVLSQALSSNLETPIAQMILDAPYPTTPAKPMLQRRTVDNDKDDFNTKPIKLRDKFLLVADQPRDPRHNLASNVSDASLQAHEKSVKMPKRITNNRTVVGSLNGDKALIAKPLPRSIIFVRPQRFQDASPGKKIRIGHMITLQMEECAQSNFEKDDIED